MPGVFILTVFPTLLLGVVFVSLALSMRRQHPSRDRGNRRLAEDGVLPIDEEGDLDAIPEAIEEEITTRFRDLERWTDDGAPRRAF